jgi:cyclic pyranopterin phosphate synthase
MRCVYCRPAQLEHPRGEALLTPGEIETLVSHLATRHALRKVRLTGGDPTSRPELVEIIERVARVPGIRDVAMTTNGLTLPRHASTYAAAGLRRVNVSLDTLDAARFARLTGVDGLHHVRAGIDAALAAGLSPLRINTVVIRENLADLPALVGFAADRQAEIRFIELMPMGPLAATWHENYVPEAEMRRVLEPITTHRVPLEQGADSARRWRLTLDDGRQVTVGFITPMSCNFCAACNRIRVAADGELYPCLMAEPAGTLLPALRPRYDPDRLDALLVAGLTRKRTEHPHDGFVVMTHIGG